MIYTFSKEIYNKEALLKAAYSYTDKAYLHISVDAKNYYVDISPKSEDDRIDENSDASNDASDNDSQ